MPSDIAESTGGESAAPASESTATETAPVAKERKLKSVDTMPASKQQNLPLNGGSGTAPETTETPQIPEFFDYVHDGQSYQLPGALQSVLKTQADAEKDYRQKTMSLADERRAHEAQVQQWQTQQRMEQQYGTLVSEARQLDAFIQQYRDANGFINVDWDKYEEMDPNAAAKLERKINRYQTRISDIQNRIAAMDQQAHQAAQQEMSQTMSQFESELPLKIAGWNDDLKTKLADFATTYGYSGEDFQGINDVRAMQILNDAMYGHQARQSASADEQPAPPPPKPVTTPGHSNQAKPKNKFSSKDTPEEYRRKRVAQINARKGR